METKIINRITNKILFRGCSDEKLKNTVEKAVNKKINLIEADLPYAELEGANLAGANLAGANLIGANLIGANLAGANLAGANLEGANLSGSNLEGANLEGANLVEANLSIANLSDSDLSNSDLSRAILFKACLASSKLINADLVECDLRKSDLFDVDFTEANFCKANLYHADFTSANLYKATLIDTEIKNISYCKPPLFFNLQCPEEGSFIGYKKCENDRIVKLLILKDSKRSSATSRRCRASKVKVLDISNIENTKKFNTATSYYNSNFIYRVNAILEILDFDENRWNECTTGIHFYITRDEAVHY